MSNTKVNAIKIQKQYPIELEGDLHKDEVCFKHN